MRKVIFVMAILSTLVGVGLLILQNNALATLSNSRVSIYDDIAGAPDARYKFEFETDNTNPATQIVITFPADYSGRIQNGVIATTETMNQSVNCGEFNLVCGDLGAVIHNGQPVTVTELSGNTAQRKITLKFDATALNGTIVFGLLKGITNPGQAGTTDQFSITTNAGGEIGQSNIDGVTIIPGDADHLGFYVQPAGSVSGQVLTTQPQVAVYNQYDVLITDSNIDIVLSVASGGGTLLGTLTVGAVGGIATFSDITYNATSDHEVFTLAADNPSFAQAISNDVESQVIATKFHVEFFQGATQVSAARNGAIGIDAVDAEGIVDVEYEGAGKTFTLTAGGTDLSTHISPNGTAPNYPSSETIAEGFTSGQFFILRFAFSLPKAELLGPVTVTSYINGTPELSGQSEFMTVYSDILRSFSIVPNSYTQHVNTAFGLTISALDAFGNVVDGLNGGSAYDQNIQFSSNSDKASFSQSGITFEPSHKGIVSLSDLVTVSEPNTNFIITVTENKEILPLLTSDSDPINIVYAPSGSGGNIISPPRATPTIPAPETPGIELPVTENPGTTACEGLSFLARVKCEATELFLKIISTPRTFPQLLGYWRESVALFTGMFGHEPSSAKDWEDILKIALGRWPTQRVESLELKAMAIFRQVYLRSADMTDRHDNAAVTIMAYGLRPMPRNINSEISAVNIYVAIFKRLPQTAQDWSVVRAIAYSGATR